MKISVIIPLLKEDINKHFEIERMLYSALNQKTKDIEIIILGNDLNELQYKYQEPCIKYMQTNKNAMPQILNDAVALSSDNYICFLDINSLLLFNSLTGHLEALSKNPEHMACYGFGLDVDKDFKAKQTEHNNIFYNKMYEKLPENNLKSFLLMDIRPDLASIMVKKEVFNYIKFNEELDVSYALDFFINLLKKYENKIIQLKEPLYLNNGSIDLKNYKKKSFVVRHLKQYLQVYDDFFEKDNLNIFSNVKNKAYRDLFLKYIFVVLEYYSNDFKLLFYVIGSYLKRLVVAKWDIYDFYFVFILFKNINSIRPKS